MLDRTTGRLEHDQLHKADQLLLLRHHVDGHLATIPPPLSGPSLASQRARGGPRGPRENSGCPTRSFSRSFWGASGESSRRLLGSLWEFL